jgi:DNA-binding MurR/RpiR family transcriptional regulator
MKKSAARAAAPTINLPARVEHLSAKRQEIIRPILEHPREYVLLSVRAMAKRLRTDPATVVRIVRGLGFASYREFQHHLHELSLAFATSLDTMQPADRDADMPAFVRDSLGQDLKNLQGLKNSLDAQRLAALAKRFYEARRIVVLASDLASVLADYLEYQISLLGLPIFAAKSAGRIMHVTRAVNKRDLVVAVTFRRGLRQTVEGARQARAHGAYCIGISDTYISPLARECHELFVASTESTSFGASYVAPVALLDAILAACGQYRRPHTIELLKEIAEEQRKGFRWYAD